VGGALVGGGAPYGSNVMKWSGTAWVPVGAFDFNVWTLAVYNGELYAAGDFTTVDGLSVNGIARWNGTAWSDPESGFNGTVQALTVWNGKLVAAGYFTSANVAANYIAAFDGNNWSALGSGTNAQVMGLGTWAGNLAAVGFFTTAGSVAAPHLALWDGTSWSSPGGGVNNIAYSTTNWNGDLIVGGIFNQAGGVPAASVARWDGTAWHAMGAGLTGSISSPNYVFAFQDYAGKLYAGGTFVASGGVAMSNLGAWDGTSWSAGGWGLSYGVSNSSVNALAVHGTDLIAAGVYTYGVMKYTSPLASVGPSGPPALRLSAPSPNPSRGVTELAYELPRAGAVNVAVFDLSGRRVRTLASGTAGAGNHTATWDGRDEQAALAPNGAYVVRLEAGGLRAARKLVLIH
jgi:hypothetical protein